MSFEPVVVFYKFDKCPHCQRLSKIWETPVDRNSESVVSAIKKVYPRMRFFIAQAKDNSGELVDKKNIPAGIRKYGNWFPKVLLIPGPLWDYAVSKISTTNDVEISYGVQVFNAVWSEAQQEWTWRRFYDYLNPESYATWIREAMNNPDFKDAQENKVLTGSNKPVFSKLENQLLRPIERKEDFCSEIHFIPRP
jgi:hypothetical protein